MTSVLFSMSIGWCGLHRRDVLAAMGAATRKGRGRALRPIHLNYRDKLMWPDNNFLDLVGVDLPIIQAPMAGSSSMEMALAVSRVGGLGSLACATMDTAKLRETLTVASQATSKPINVNFFAHDAPLPQPEQDARWLEILSPYFDEMGVQPPELTTGLIEPFDDARCDVIEAISPGVVSFHFGLPSVELVGRIKATGAKILSTATTVDEAVWLEGNGCDAVIAQGFEAGGHRGMFLTKDPLTQIGTMALVPQIADAVKVPVIAAGGIADGRGIAAAFALGASCVQIGTAYLFTKEATIGEVYKNALHTAKSGHTALTNVFSGRPARCLMNRMMRELGPFRKDSATFPKGINAMAALKNAGELADLRDFSAHYCGQSAALGYETTAAQLTQDVALDATRRCADRKSVV